MYSVFKFPLTIVELALYDYVSTKPSKPQVQRILVIKFNSVCH